MKKIISILLLCAIGCEFHSAHDHDRSGTHYYPTAVVVEPAVTVNYCGYDPYPYSTEWADYCIGDCCAWEIYDGFWTCQETWCYDTLFCEWKVTEVCF